MFIFHNPTDPEISADSKNFALVKLKILGIFFICVTACQSLTVDIKNTVCIYFITFMYSLN